MHDNPSEIDADFVHGIYRDLSDPGRWPSLSEERLCQVVGSAIIIYAELTAEALIPAIRQMYPYLVKRVSPERRLVMLDNIMTRLCDAETVPDDSMRHRLDALLPFMVHDPSALVASTATLDFALLRGPTSDPWMGVNQAFGLFEVGGQANRAAIMMGLLALGDRRLSQAILKQLALVEPEVAVAVAALSVQRVYAATVELCCDWLDAVAANAQERDQDGMVFGSVAGLLYRLGARADVTGVVDIQRCFPPVSASRRSEHLGAWTRQEYARIIGPRLQSMAERERGERILPDVMGGWGLRFASPN